MTFAEYPELPELCPRQWQVMQLLVKGKSPKEAGWELGLSLKTIQYHWKIIKLTVGVKSYVELVWYALERGWVKP